MKAIHLVYLALILLSGPIFAAESSDPIKVAISRKEVIPGMTEKQVILAIGSPNSKSNQKMLGLDISRWFYQKERRTGDSVKFETKIVTFRNGVVISFYVNKDR